MLNLYSLGFGFLLAGIDLIMMYITKQYSKGIFASPGWMIIPPLLYALDPFILLSSLRFETLAVVNMIWNVISNILVTAMAFFILGETVSSTKMIGIGLSFVALFFLSYE
jgi:multidrug transporter EmrE-like cation transporter